MKERILQKLQGVIRLVTLDGYLGARDNLYAVKSYIGHQEQKITELEEQVGRLEKENNNLRNINNTLNNTIKGLEELGI